MKKGHAFSLATNYLNQENVSDMSHFLTRFLVDDFLLFLLARIFFFFFVTFLFFFPVIILNDFLLIPRRYDVR